MQNKIRVLMITSEYPTPDNPRRVPFIARHVEFLRRAGVDVEVFHFRGKKNPLNYIAAWRGLRKFTKGKRFDLMHAQWGQSATLALPKRLPWVITFRGDDVEGIIGNNGAVTFAGRVVRLVSKVTSRLADHVIVVSESLGKRLPRAEYSVIPSGLNFEVFRPIPKDEARRVLGFPLEKKLILFAASAMPNPRKRFSLAQAAVELLKDKFDAELVVATGIPHDSVPYYMNACDALLLTSVHEGSPNVVKEAIACNLPIVSVDVGDVRQRLAEIDGCFVTADDSPQTISSALEKVLERNERIDGRRHVENLDEREIARRVIEIYRKVLNGKTVSEEAINSESVRADLTSRV